MQCEERRAMRLRHTLAALGMAAMGMCRRARVKGAWRLEARGGAADARNHSRRAAEAPPDDPLALQAYAEFLDSHRAPESRAAYEKLRLLMSRNGASKP